MATSEMNLPTSRSVKYPACESHMNLKEEINEARIEFHNLFSNNLIGSRERKVGKIGESMN